MAQFWGKLWDLPLGFVSDCFLAFPNSTLQRGACLLMQVCGVLVRTWTLLSPCVAVAYVPNHSFLRVALPASGSMLQACMPPLILCSVQKKAFVKPTVSLSLTLDSWQTSSVLATRDQEHNGKTHVHVIEVTINDIQ
jgi:hypothetical protein